MQAPPRPSCKHAVATLCSIPINQTDISLVEGLLSETGETDAEIDEWPGYNSSVLAKAKPCGGRSLIALGQLAANSFAGEMAVWHCSMPLRPRFYMIHVAL